MICRGTSREAGFTIAELLVALLISAFVSLAGWFFYRHELHELTRQSANLDALDKVRAAMGFLSREIRAAGYDPKLTALTTATLKGIREASSTVIHVEWDRDRSGAIQTTAVDPSAESVRYSYDSANQRILRTVNGVATTFVSNVPAGGFSLRYYNISGTEIVPSGSPLVIAAASRDSIASVIVQIRVQTAGVTPVVPFTMASRAAVRARILSRL